MDSTRTWAPTQLGATLFAWLRSRCALRPALPSDVALALLAALAWTLIYNLQFWHQAIAAMWHPTPRAALFLVSLLVVVVCLQALLLLLMPTRVGMRIATSALLPCSPRSAHTLRAPMAPS